MKDVIRLVEESFQIAWDYLEATGELGDRTTASVHLMRTIEGLLKSGERHRLVLSNTAISTYQHFRASEVVVLVS
jgi:hypothetical protein